MVFSDFAPQKNAIGSGPFTRSFHREISIFSPKIDDWSTGDWRLDELRRPISS
jgi:hypothetical protein